MPQFLTPFIASLAASTALAAPAALASTVYSLTYGAIYIGASLGLSYLSSLIFRPATPKPEDVQQSTKQPLSPRYRHYGRVKTSGAWVFAGSKAGNFHKVLALGQGPISGIEQYWVDDRRVYPGDDGWVPTHPYNSKLRILERLGDGTETYYSSLANVFPRWTSAHKGLGVVSIYARQGAVNSKKYYKIYPNGINTNYRVVLRGAKVENPLTGETRWDDNAAAIIRDYLYHEEGLRLPKSLLTTPVAAAKWQESYNKCDVAYDLKAGGTEPRYRLWGSYNYEERPADILNRMLVACDGRLMLTNDGGLTLDIGDMPANPVVIDESMIIGFSEVARGRDVMTTANTIKARFTSPEQDYQSAEADPWVDSEDVGLRGEISQSVEFLMSPSHAQTRRLMKLAAYRANPNWVGSFSCSLKALKAFGERYCKIEYPTFGINETFEIIDLRFDIGEGDILRGVAIQVQSMPKSAYSWAKWQEGTEPVSDDEPEVSDIPDVTNFNVTIKTKTVAGSPVPYAFLTFDAAPDGLQTEARGKLVSDTEWTSIAVEDGASSADSFILSDGDDYEFQVRYYGLDSGDYTDSIEITAIADTVAPSIVTNVVATAGSGKVAFTWKTPNSANCAGTNFYRNTTNNEGTATLVYTEYGGPSTNFSWTDTPLTAGPYYYWLRARNASGVESASVVTGLKTVT